LKTLDDIFSPPIDLVVSLDVALAYGCFLVLLIMKKKFKVLLKV